MTDRQGFFGRVLVAWRSDLGLPLWLAREAAVTDAGVRKWLASVRREHISLIAAHDERHRISRAVALARAEVFNALLAQIAADVIDGDVRSKDLALRDAIADSFFATLSNA